MDREQIVAAVYRLSDPVVPGVEPAIDERLIDRDQAQAGIDGARPPIDLFGDPVDEVEPPDALERGAPDEQGMPERVVEHCAPGVATGHDLNSVFRDASSQPPTNGMSPFPVPVTPADPLSTLNSERTAGDWTIDIAGNVNDKVGLWSWGLQFNNSPAGVDPPAPANGVLLAMRGANPVRAGGRFAFTLPVAARARLALYDTQGRECRLLWDADGPPGTTLVAWSARGLAPGAYFARLSVDGRAAGAVRLVIVD